ncbi:hypothetical protein D1AOALGA4SA_10013 [Olavius algarvensis Delta 1 endosymbiont]|nr:hypothetical protein D1AOALGA4SA_10013 [Olavius algarvensis Delta 1 endosymbiont]
MPINIPYLATLALPLAASVRSDRKRNFKKQILDFGMRILDLRYSACRESFVERSIL